jgi:P27 family predicted phage terminase small subunit
MKKEAFGVYEEIKAHCMVEMGFKEIDEYGLQLLADAVNRYRICQDVLDREGLTQEAKKTGFLVPRPEAAMQKQALEIILKFSDRFGLSPAARKKILGRQKEKGKEKEFGFDLN